MERRRNWSFLAVDDESWIWRVSDSQSSSDSPRTFATLKECTADAMQHGYVPWKSEDERRRAMALEVTRILSREKAEK